MKTLFDCVAIASCIATAAVADVAHDVFNANRESILARPISVWGEVAFSVGRASSPANRGSAVGFAKAEEIAKWNMGDRHRATAAWPVDIRDEEKESAWIEYRSQHAERFSVCGMQRIFSKKHPPDVYTVVMSFPAKQVDIPAPTADELQRALDRVRERKRILEEQDRQVGRGAAEPAKADVHNSSTEHANGTIEKLDGIDEDLML